MGERGYACLISRATALDASTKGQFLSDVEAKTERSPSRDPRPHQQVRRYSAKQDKDFAVKTIRRIERGISNLQRRNPRASSGSEDSWRP